MWIKYKKKIKYYRVTNKDGSTYITRIGWYYFRRWKDQLEKVEEFGKWEWYERWIGKRGYQKKAHHKKKPKEQTNREAWRQHKQTKRDKAKRQDLHGHHSDGCPKWMKRHCNKKHRQWERHMIDSGKYERMGAKYKRKDIFDPWLWD
jgi:hypothetical protein